MRIHWVQQAAVTLNPEKRIQNAGPSPSAFSGKIQTDYDVTSCVIGFFQRSVTVLKFTDKGKTITFLID